MAPIVENGHATLKRLLFPACIFALSLILYVVTLCSSILPGDSGELIAASHTLSIAHPPGFPLYLMLGRLFSSAFGWGSIAWRFNLFSAILASVTLVLLYELLREFGVLRPVGLGITLAIATQEAFWLQATAAEVYVLSALFAVLLLYAAFLTRRYGERGFLLLAFIGGLSVSHHLTLLYAFISALVLLLLFLRFIPRPQTILFGFLLFLGGLTVWLYIPVRANLDPPLTWGETGTVNGFVSHILASRYAWKLKTFDFLLRAGDFGRFFRLAVGECGLPLALLSAVGLAAHIRKLSLIAGLLCLVTFYAIHYATYSTHDIHGHILPFLIVPAVLAGLGVQALLTRLERLSRLIKPLILAGLAVIVILNLSSFAPRKDEWFALDYAEAIAESAVDAANGHPVVLASGGLASQSMHYVSLVERQDVTFFVKGISPPSMIRSSTSPKSIKEAAHIASRNFGMSNVTVLGDIEAGFVSRASRICGMVSVLDTGKTECSSPLRYPIRGAGEEPRDFYSRALTAEYYLHIARWHIQSGDLASAVEYLDRVVEVAHGDAQTYIDVSRLYYVIDHPDDALRVLKEAVDAEPTHFFAHFALANALEFSGRLDEALLEYQQALRGNPDPSPVHVNLGSIYSSKGDHALALSHFRKALEIDSTKVAAYVSMGVTLESMGEFDQALASLARACRLDSTYALAFHANASLLMRLERYNDALEVLKKGLGASSDNPLLLSDVGLCYLRTDALDSAIAYFEKALEIDPTLIATRGNLAVAYERRGFRSKAIEAYRKYIEGAPPGSSRDKASEALTRLGSELGN